MIYDRIIEDIRITILLKKKKKKWDFINKLDKMWKNRIIKEISIVYNLSILLARYKNLLQLTR